MKKINFVNNQAPALNAANLNEMQNNFEDAIEVTGKVSKNLFNKKTVYIEGASNQNASNRILVQPNTTYTFSIGKYTWGEVQEFNNLGTQTNYFGGSENDKIIIFTTSANAKYIKTSFYTGINNVSLSAIDFTQIQLEKGSTATEYEEYYDPTISIRDSYGDFQEVELNKTNYSTEEQVIGTYNGKTLYRKIISKSMQPNNDNYIDTGLSNVKIVDYRAKSTPSWVNGILYNETWLISQGRCFYPNNDHSRMMLSSTASNSTSDWYFEIILEYTKN